MLGNVSGTPYDMRFSLFGVPVAVTPMFWLAAALLGWNWMSGPNGHVLFLLTWMICVFVSILVHEFGHALTMKSYGDRPHMLLYHFGGLTYPTRRETPGRSFLITAAGPGIQFALYVVLTLVCLAASTPDVGSVLSSSVFWTSPIRATVSILLQSGQIEFGTPAFAAVYSLLEINLIWPLFNLLPVLPLDGGRLVESGLAFFGVRASRLWALRTSVAVGAPVTLGFLALAYYGWGTIFLGVMFALLTVENYRTLQGPRGAY